MLHYLRSKRLHQIATFYQHAAAGGIHRLLFG